MNPERFLARIKRHPDYRDQIVHVEEIAAREGRYAALDAPLPARLTEVLAGQGGDAALRASGGGD